jgi:hypothetical protein
MQNSVGAKLNETFRTCGAGMKIQRRSINISFLWGEIQFVKWHGSWRENS